MRVKMISPALAVMEEAFNSLFEMPNFLSALITFALSILSFNSLFEMRLARFCEELRRSDLSILYLRCNHGAVGPRPQRTGVQLSILYLRCPPLATSAAPMIRLQSFQFSI